MDGGLFCKECCIASNESPVALPCKHPDEEGVDHASLREHWLAWSTHADNNAREVIFQHYVGLARRMAYNMHAKPAGKNIDYHDLVQFACVGLLEAINRYNPTSSASFQTFATPRIRGAMLEGIRQWTEANEQLSFQRRQRRERAALLSEAETGADPFASLASLATGLAIGVMLQDSSMYSGHEESHSPYGNAYENVAWQQSCTKLRQAVSTLPEAAGKVIRYHYFDLLPFEQIAVLLGLSKGRISQLHRTGLEELRKVLQPAHFSTG